MVGDKLIAGLHCLLDEANARIKQLEAELDNTKGLLAQAIDERIAEQQDCDALRKERDELKAKLHKMYEEAGVLKKKDNKNEKI